MSHACKEWTLVCDALGRGDQSIILRKGGIAEGRAGFRFAHDDFLLFPTLFHEQIEQLRVAPGTTLPQADELSTVEIRYRVRVEWTHEITDLDVALRLAPFHIWRDSVIEERFRYKDGGSIYLACVRVAVLDPAHRFPTEPKYGGCRSWVEVPDLSDSTTARPVLDDATHRERAASIRATMQLEPPMK